MEIVRHRKWFFLLSGTLVLISIISLLIPPALVPGIDFTGGAAITVSYQQPVTATQVQQALSSVGQSDAIVQSTGNNGFFIRTGVLTLDVRDQQGNVIKPGQESQVRQALSSIGTANIQNFQTISGVVGAQNVRNAIIAVLVAAVAIMFYVTWAFRRVPNPFRYGTSAIVALAHDTVISVGLFSILGKTIHMEVNTMFITGILLVIGYSVNDTIVIFDRVRENITKFPGAPIAEVVGLSVKETMARSLNTSITVLIVVIALILFATQSIQPLLYVTAAGVVVGTYSSIFIASLMLVSWENGELGRWLRRVMPFIGSRERATA